MERIIKRQESSCSTLASPARYVFGIKVAAVYPSTTARIDTLTEPVHNLANVLCGGSKLLENSVLTEATDSVSLPFISEELRSSWAELVVPTDRERLLPTIIEVD